jgi:hypothetical protein
LRGRWAVDLLALLLILGYVVLPVAAIIATIHFADEADSPTGDGFILGCLLAAFPFWPLTMSYWLWYMLSRHREATILSQWVQRIRNEERAAQTQRGAVKKERAAQKTAHRAARDALLKAAGPGWQVWGPRGAYPETAGWEVKAYPAGSPSDSKGFRITADSPEEAVAEAVRRFAELDRSRKR